MTPYDKLVEHIEVSGGLLDGEAQIDGKWHNIPAEEGKKGNKSFGYIAFQNEDGSIGGKVKNYFRHDEQGENFIFRDEQQQAASRAEWAAQQRDREARERERAERNAASIKEREAGYDRAAEKAKYIYNKLPPAPASHPYLDRKEVAPHLAKVNQAGMLVIPMINEQGNIRSLEFIGDNGFKKVLTGAQAAGSFTPLGFEKGTKPDRIIIAEGFATAASINEATGTPTVHARGKGNMKAATEIMQNRYPDAEIILAADNDKSKVNNAGLKAAEDIQREHPSVKIMLPEIDGDFNDVAVQYGSHTIREKFNDVEKNQYLSPERKQQSAINTEKERTQDHNDPAMLTENQVDKLLLDGKYEKVAEAVNEGKVELTPSLATRLMEVPDDRFAAKMMDIALQDTNPQVREAAAAMLVKTNEGAIGANYNDIGIDAVQHIEHDASAISKFAAKQTDLDKQGVDLPDDIKNVITSWKEELKDRQAELGLSDAQVKKLSAMFEANIIANSDKKLLTPKELKNKQLLKEQQQDHER